METSRKANPVAILCLAVSLLLGVMLSACSGSSTIQWSAQEELRSIGAEGISSITYVLYTEGGALSHSTNDPGEIEEIYLRLCNVQMTDATQAGVDDDGLLLLVQAGKQELEFEFEGDILVLDPEHRFEVEQLGSLKSYLEALMDEATPADEAVPVIETTPVEEGQATGTQPDTGGMSVFASDDMGFSFLYDSAYTAYLTETGACELDVNDEPSLVGLYVSVVESTNLPEVSQIIEEGMFGETQKYLNAIAQPPAENEITMDGHVLQGYIFAYSDRQGRTVDCSYYIENRDGHYIYYRTEVYRDEEDYWAGQDAMATAVKTLELSSDAYGASDAVSGNIGS